MQIQLHKHIRANTQFTDSRQLGIYIKENKAMMSLEQACHAQRTARLGAPSWRQL